MTTDKIAIFQYEKIHIFLKKYLQYIILSNGEK